MAMVGFGDEYFNDLIVQADLEVQGTATIEGDLTVDGTLTTFSFAPASITTGNIICSSINNSGDLIVDTNTLVVDSSNNMVGIGITNPQEKLHLHENSSNSNIIKITNDTTGETNSDGFEIGIGSGEGAILRNKENTDMDFYTNNTLQMTIANSGNINVVNEVSVNACSSIGSLGYILVGSDTTTTLSNVNFSFIVDLVEFNENQSLDTFSFYTMIIKGELDGNGSTPHIEYRFQDLSGDISDTNAYHNSIVGYGGTSIISNRSSNGELIFSSGATSAVRRFFSSFKLTTGTPSDTQDTFIIGQSSVKSNDGTDFQNNNISSGLTNQAVINTQILSIGFRAQNVNTGVDRILNVRIYRMF